MTDASTPFDPVAYWRARHDQYLSDSTGVGNVALDAVQNERIYAAIEQYVGAIAGSLKARGARRVLDLGCGIGMLAGAFVRHDLEYIGVDVSATAIEIASAKHPRARFTVGDIASLPFSDTFDIVIERTVFIHLIDESIWQSALRQVKRSLAPEGVFILIDQLPLDAASAPSAAAHVKFRLREQYEREFAAIGLRFDPSLRAEVARHVALSEHTHMITHR
jgi:SAM-dependent methyltransferase